MCGPLWPINLDSDAWVGPTWVSVKGCVILVVRVRKGIRRWMMNESMNECILLSVREEILYMLWQGGLAVCSYVDP